MKAWVYIPTLHISSKEMDEVDIRQLCEKHNMGVWDQKKEEVVDIKDYPLKKERRNITTYGFVKPMSYQVNPSVTLVPVGTTVSYGMFQFPKGTMQPCVSSVVLRADTNQQMHISCRIDGMLQISKLLSQTDGRRVSEAVKDGQNMDAVKDELAQKYFKNEIDCAKLRRDENQGVKR